MLAFVGSGPTSQYSGKTLVLGKPRVKVGYASTRDVITLTVLGTAFSQNNGFPLGVKWADIVSAHRVPSPGKLFVPDNHRGSSCLAIVLYGRSSSVSNLDSYP